MSKFIFPANRSYTHTCLLYGIMKGRCTEPRVTPIKYCSVAKTHFRYNCSVSIVRTLQKIQHLACDLNNLPKESPYRGMPLFNIKRITFK